MAQSNPYSGIKSVLHLSSDGNSSCSECKRYGFPTLEGAVNHWMQEHGYKLLHVGQKTHRDQDGNLYHTTVAIVGEPE